MARVKAQYIPLKSMQEISSKSSFWTVETIAKL